MERPGRKFYFFLALSLGMTVRQLLQSIDSHELSEWHAYYEIEHFGETWYQTGMIASTVANSVRDPKKKKKPYSPSDFMPIVSSNEEQDNTEKMLMFARVITEVLGGEVKA